MKRKVLTYNQYINERFGFENFDIDKANKIAERLFKSTNSEIVNKIIKHKDKLIYGFQSHPEVSGEDGLKMVQNFLKMCEIV